MLEITDIPADYVTITSGLGKTVPKHLTLVPFVFNDQVEAVMAGMDKRKPQFDDV